MIHSIYNWAIPEIIHTSHKEEVFADHTLHTRAQT